MKRTSRKESQKVFRKYCWDQVKEIQQDSQVLAKVTAPNRIGLVEKTVGIKAGKMVQLCVTSAKDGRRHHCIMASVEAPKP